MTSKWGVLLIPWITFTGLCAMETHNVFTTDLPIRVMIVTATLAVTGVLAAIAQPWKPDPPSTTR
jgi:hypothetical protein